ncbi:MAG: ERF family protein [Pseudomonadota bacterium]
MTTAESTVETPVSANGTKPDQPRNVIEAIAAVMRDLPGIGKLGRAAPEQGGYAYRGIEAITEHLQQLMGRYCLVLIPRELSYEVRDITVAGKPWTDTTIRMEYDAYGPGGIEDHLVIGPLTAVGRDNSDKGANKGRTQAYKYVLLQAFCVGDKKDDADSGSPEADAPVSDQQRLEQARIDLFSRIKAMSDEGKATLKEWWAGQDPPIGTKPREWDELAIEETNAHLDDVEKAEQERPPEPSEIAAAEAVVAEADHADRLTRAQASLAEAEKVAKSHATEPQAPPTGSEAVQGTLAGPDAPAVTGPSTADRLAVAIATVKAMDTVEVLAELESRELDTSGKPDTVRKRLAEALAAE